MKISLIETINELKNLVEKCQRGGFPIVFVPTMGALHAGHVSLMQRARAEAGPDGLVIASIFVNPTQFGAGEDFSRYPRDLQADVAKLDAAGVDAAFVPTVEAIYPSGPATNLSAGAIGTRWEGESRPGHFDGVATVVARLFELVEPDVAIFGEKDFQQFAVIQQMVADQGLKVKLIKAPTMREVDGLAMSSRNAYLSEAERSIAPKLYETLLAVRDDGRIEDAKQALLAAGFDKIDYLALVDGTTLEPLQTPASNARIIVAAWLGNTRLIDNLGMADE